MMESPLGKRAPLRLANLLVEALAGGDLALVGRVYFRGVSRELGVLLLGDDGERIDLWAS